MGSNAEPEESRTIQSVERTLEILEALKQLNGARLSELSELTGMSHSSIHHYLMSLQKHGYVVKYGNTYDVSVRFFSLGGYARHRRKIYQDSRDRINDLAAETGETARLVIEHDGHCITVYQTTDEGADQSQTYAGFEESPHSTAAGKAILAELSREEVESIVEYHGLPARTENTIVDEDELYEELERVRSNGYAVDDQECFEGLFCIADSVRTSDGNVLGAISVSAPVDRIDRQEFLEEVTPLLNNTTGVLEISHTYSYWEDN